MNNEYETEIQELKEKIETQKKYIEQLEEELKTYTNNTSRTDLSDCLHDFVVPASALRYFIPISHDISATMQIIENL